jgi:steroid delta-isomerase
VKDLERLVAFFESLTPDSARYIGAFYAEDAYFRDPFNEVRGIAGITRVFEHMFVQVHEPRFKVTERFRAEGGAFLAWDFTFRSRPGAELMTVKGASHLRFDESGKVSYHCDYWDAAGELYEKVPVLGALLRFVRRRLSAAR